MLENLINPTPARNLINKFYYQLPNNGYLNYGLMSCEKRYREATTCAIICVEEIKATLYNYGEPSYELQNMDREFAYWDRVQDELIQIKNEQE